MEFMNKYTWYIPGVYYEVNIHQLANMA